MYLCYMGRYKKLGGIYLIFCTSNQKSYIGSSNCIKRRLNSHRYYLKKGSHDNEHLQRAYTKYGIDSFIYSVLEYCEDSELIERETLWVNKYNSLDPSKGYNKIPPGSYPMDYNPSRPREYIKLYQFYQGDRITTNSREVLQRIDFTSSKLFEILSYWKQYPKKVGRKSWKGYTFVRVEDYNENIDYTLLGNQNRVPWRKPKQTLEERRIKDREYRRSRRIIVGG